MIYRDNDIATSNPAKHTRVGADPLIQSLYCVVATQQGIVDLTKANHRQTHMHKHTRARAFLYVVQPNRESHATVLQSSVYYALDASGNIVVDGRSGLDQY